MQGFLLALFLVMTSAQSQQDPTRVGPRGASSRGALTMLTVPGSVPGLCVLAGAIVTLTLQARK